MTDEQLPSIHEYPWKTTVANGLLAEVIRLREQANKEQRIYSDEVNRHDIVKHQLKAAKAVCEMVSVFEELSPEGLTPLLDAYRATQQPPNQRKEANEWRRNCTAGR